MGIPKFFRYISERWPTISQLVNGNIVPEFDNLYLDMNSIIHTCTHKDDDDATHRMTEEEMMISIFNYIEHLFSIIKPQKVFYMAIDGVAPRAKMNQQRSRRFKSAKEAEDSRRDAINKGTELPREEPFDSNCITPGTEFMANLTRHLKHFINRKISEDSSWKNVEVILSGHEVPGEGEHKIMNFLRSLRSTEQYNPNTRHCLYGLDADLIMLGLSTHEPHFALLREEVVFNRREMSRELSEKRFFLLHLSLVRDYMQLEFDRVIQEGFNFERILDDFILINFFIGNDFLPETPMLLINDGALPVIFDTYMNYLIKSKDYLSHDGIINFANLKVWLEGLSAHQTSKFEEQAKDAEWVNNDLDELTIDDNLILSTHEKELVRSVKPFILGSVATENLDDYSYRLPSTMTVRDAQVLGLLAQQTSFILVDHTQPDGSIVTDLLVDTARFPTGDEGKREWLKETRKIIKVYEKAEVKEDHQRRKELYGQKLNSWRNKYYKSKFSASQDDERIKQASKNYLEGLQWVMSYYYRGCPSWSWFYHEHYGPMTSDLYDGITPDFEASFGPSEPFKPFEQLMGVLPDRSAPLVPPAYRDLMSSDTSPILDFYPHDFATDKNGKKHDWESVVLIPFIDANRLQEALAKREGMLTTAEKERNRRGTDLLFTYDPNKQFTYPASAPWLNDIVGCSCQVKAINPHELDPTKIVYGLLENARLGKEKLAGFPSINTLEYSFHLESAGVRVFERQSIIESICLSIKNSPSIKDMSFEEIAKQLVNTVTYIGYPFLHEAKIFAVSNDDCIFKRFSNPFTDLKEKRIVTKERDDVLRSYRGTKAVFFKPSNIVVHCNRLKGLQRMPSGDYQKVYSEETTIFPIELLVKNVVMEDERFAERTAAPVEEEYPIGSRTIVLLQKNYGSEAEITGYNDGKLNIDVRSINESGVSYSHQVAKMEANSQRYCIGGEIARAFKMSPLVFSQLTSRALVKWGDNKYNIGLVLKKPAQNLMASGYTRKEGTSWTYSSLAKELFGEYYSTFKQPLSILIDIMSQSSSGITDVKKALKSDNKDESLHNSLKEMAAWTEKMVSPITFIDTETEQLSNKSVALIEEWSRVIAAQRTDFVPLKINNVHRRALVDPEMMQHQLSKQHFYLGDRVMYALDHGKVAQFARGIVVGIKKSSNYTSIEVIFDEEFSAGSSLDGRVASKRGLTVDSGSLLNISTKELAYDRSSAFIPAETLGQERHSSRPSGFKSGSKKFVPSIARSNAWAKDSHGGPVPSQSAAKIVSQVNSQGVNANFSRNQPREPQYSLQASQELFDQVKSNSEQHAKSQVQNKQNNAKKPPTSKKVRSKKGKSAGSPKPENKKQEAAVISPLEALQAELAISTASDSTNVNNEETQTQMPRQEAVGHHDTPPFMATPMFNIAALHQNANKKDSESLLKLLKNK